MAVLSVDDMKAHLNITSSVNDAELADIIDAAEAAIAARVGPLEPTTVTSVIDSGGGVVALPLKPVISITSTSATVPFGTVTVPGGLVVDGATGVVTSLTEAVPAGRYTVTYVAGRETLPPDLLLAVKEMARHLWTTQRGGSRRPGSTDDENAPGYLIPNRVAELMKPHKIFTLGFI